MPRLGEIPLGDLSPRHVEDACRQLMADGLSPRMIRLVRVSRRELANTPFAGRG